LSELPCRDAPASCPYVNDGLHNSIKSVARDYLFRQEPIIPSEGNGTRGFSPRKRMPGGFGAKLAPMENEYGWATDENDRDTERVDLSTGRLICETCEAAQPPRPRIPRVIVQNFKANKPAKIIMGLKLLPRKES